MLIFLAILAVIIILLFCVRLKAHIEYNSVSEKLKIKVTVFGIPVFDSEKKKKSKPAKVKKQKQLKEKKPKKENKLNFRTIIASVKKVIGDIIRLIIKRLVIKKLYIEIAVASDEPDKTAINTGNANAYAYSADALLRNAFRVKSSKIKIYPDFLSDKTKTYFEIVASLSVLLTITGALSTLISIFKDIIIKDKI